jgi:hypothetical protein
MTEYEHMPPIVRFETKWLSDRSLQIFVHGQYLFLNPGEVRGMRDALDAALEGDGPQIVCEVVR